MEFLRFLEALRTPLLDCVMSVVTAFGGETVFMLAAMAAYWCYDKRFGYYIMSTGFIGTVLNQFFKLIFHVPRPWVLDGRFTIVESAREGATGYSFPSGHTQNAVTVFRSKGMHGCAARHTNCSIDSDRACRLFAYVSGRPYACGRALFPGAWRGVNARAIPALSYRKDRAYQHSSLWRNAVCSRPVRIVSGVLFLSVVA